MVTARLSPRRPPCEQRAAPADAGTVPHDRARGHVGTGRRPHRTAPVPRDADRARRPGSSPDALDDRPVRVAAGAPDTSRAHNSAAIWMLNAGDFRDIRRSAPDLTRGGPTEQSVPHSLTMSRPFDCCRSVRASNSPPDRLGPHMSRPCTRARSACIWWTPSVRLAGPGCRMYVDFTSKIRS